MRSSRTIFALIAVAAPAAAIAQTAPKPLAPETWRTTEIDACTWHACYGEGSVRYAVTVSPAGRVTGCDILQSSGNIRLDETTCRFLTRGARFTPARDEGGKAVAGRFEGWMHWKLPDEPPMSFAPEAQAD
jgi:protein TonB